jgi:hypothetical protein
MWTGLEGRGNRGLEVSTQGGALCFIGLLLTKYHIGDDIEKEMAYRRERKGVCNVWVGTPEGKRQLGRSRSRWKDNIRMIFKRSVGTAWSGLLWLRIGTGGGRL